MRNGGWLYRLADSDNRRKPRLRRATVSVHSSPEFGQLADRYEQAASADLLARFARDLGVSVDSLQRLHVGWDGKAWTFPMGNASGRILGIRLRFPNGKKLSESGGREGLFIPSGIGDCSPIVVAEGPTDTAALLTLGLSALGRPSCSGGVQILCEYCRLRRVAILVDGDEPGRRGAFNLAEELKLVCTVRLIRPPEGVKDARDWLTAGGTRADVEQAIERAKPIRLRVGAL